MSSIALRIQVGRLGRNGRRIIDTTGFAPPVLSVRCWAVSLDLLPRWRDGLQLANSRRRRRRIPSPLSLRRPLAVVETSIVHGFRLLQHVAICLSRRRVVLGMAIRMRFDDSFPILGLDGRRVTGVSV